MLGIESLIGFAVVLSRVDSAFAGRACAAIRGIYIATSLVWLGVVERQAPTRWDLGGSALAIIGALVLIGLHVGSLITANDLSFCLRVCERDGYGAINAAQASLKLSLPAPKTEPPEPTAANSLDRGND